MGALAQRSDLLLRLVIDPGLDEILGEHVTFGEVIVILAKCLEGGLEGFGQLSDLGVLLRGKLVEVLIDRIGLLDAVLDAV